MRKWGLNLRDWFIFRIDLNIWRTLLLLRTGHGRRHHAGWRLLMLRSLWHGRTWSRLEKEKGTEMRIHVNTASIVEPVENEISLIWVMKHFYDNCYRDTFRAIITVDGEFIPACSSPSCPCVPELLGSDYDIRMFNFFLFILKWQYKLQCYLFQYSDFYIKPLKEKSLSRR